MTTKQKLKLHLIDLFYYPLRLFFKKCTLDRAWLTQKFSNNSCAPSYCDTPEKNILQLIGFYLKTAGPHGQYLRILEPSFGRGHIVRSLLEHFPKSVITGFEVDIDRYFTGRKIIEANSYYSSVKPKLRLMNRDFLMYSSEDEFDLIIMVPPFSGSQFFDHVRHAASFLTFTGTLVAIIPEAAFNSMTLRAVKFRAWINTEFVCSTVSMGAMVCNYPVLTVMIKLRKIDWQKPDHALVQDPLLHAIM